MSQNRPSRPGKLGFAVLPLGAGAGTLASGRPSPVASGSSRGPSDLAMCRRHGKSNVSFMGWRRLTPRCSRHRRGTQSIVNCTRSAAASVRLSFVRYAAWVLHATARRALLRQGTRLPHAAGRGLRPGGGSSAFVECCCTFSVPISGGQARRGRGGARTTSVSCPARSWWPHGPR